MTKLGLFLLPLLAFTVALTLNPFAIGLAFVGTVGQATEARMERRPLEWVLWPAVIAVMIAWGAVGRLGS